MKKILIIGDSCIDKWIYGKCDRLSPDGPVPVLVPIEEKINTGMAGNVNENVLSLIKKLKLKVTVDFITNQSEVIKTRYVDKKSNQLILRVDTGDSEVKHYDITNLPNKTYDIVIISDYNKGFLSKSDIQYICKKYNNVFIDTKKQLGKWINDVDFIKINQIEYNNSINLFNENDLKDKLIVTLGDEGCKYMDTIYPVETVEVKDMVGAGDTFISALCLEYLVSNNIHSSIKFANKCATKVVQLKGVNVIK
jgi:D-beta-D-heptose 7-phosphate kinase/D-beta-D-heptose 1-phosphate adenosyltransferase